MIKLKPILISFLVLAYGNLKCQQSGAKVQVTCTDYQGVKMAGEKVVFINESGKETIGITDVNGFFETELKGPGKYKILAKSIAQSTDGGVLILPTLSDGQSYGTYQVEVQIDPAREFTLENVYFESSKAVLKSESHKELNDLYELLLHKKMLIIEIGGHTDNIGAVNYNVDLSKRRAESVKKYLVQKGISASRIKTRGYGDSMPIADNKTEEGRAMNRRTQVRILSR